MRACARGPLHFSRSFDARPAPALRFAGSVETARRTIEAAASSTSSVDRENALDLLALRRGKTPEKEALNEMFAGLMEMIRNNRRPRRGDESMR